MIHIRLWAWLWFGLSYLCDGRWFVSQTINDPRISLCLKDLCNEGVSDSLSLHSSFISRIDAFISSPNLCTKILNWPHCTVQITVAMKSKNIVNIKTFNIFIKNLSEIHRNATNTANTDVKSVAPAPADVVTSTLGVVNCVLGVVSLTIGVVTSSLRVVSSMSGVVTSVLGVVATLLSNTPRSNWSAKLLVVVKVRIHEMVTSNPSPSNRCEKGRMIPAP